MALNRVCEMTETKLTAETLKKALWLYCDAAYFKKSVPTRVIDKSLFSSDDKLETVLASRKIVEQYLEDEESGVIKYWIRMGNDFYPHMKICITKMPVESQDGGVLYVIAVDTHDRHVLNNLTPGTSEWQAILELNEKNLKLKQTIEKRWRREGVPTERDLLEGQLNIVPKKENYPHREVLIADDEKHIRLALQEILDMFNCSVFIATKGQEAIDIARQQTSQIAFALFDIMMPDVTGLNVVETLKNENLLKFPYVFLSGMPRREADPEHVHDFIAKPFTKRILVEKITSIVDRLSV